MVRVTIIALERMKLRSELESELRAQLRQNEEQLARQDKDAYAKKVQMAYGVLLMDYFDT
jgi:hypothetical protein